MQIHKILPHAKPGSTRPPAGFSLIETMVAMLILITGLLSTATMVVGGVTLSLQSKDLALANQLAKEAMEAVFTARITNNVIFDAIYNKGAGSGIFWADYKPINAPGPDGLVNTDVYLTQPPLVYVDPGKNNIYETPTGSVSPGGDDKIITFDRFRRQILIEDLNGDRTLRRVTVNVQFTSAKGVTSVVSMATVMSAFN